MPIGAGAIPIISGLLGIGTNILNAGSQARQNYMNRAWQEKMYGIQRRDALTDQAFMNEYNSPAAQMARLRAAGLNPNLVYGSGGATQQSAPVRSANANYEGKAPQFDLSPVAQALTMMYDIQKKTAETDQIKAMVELYKERQGMATAQKTGILLDNQGKEQKIGLFEHYKQHGLFDYAIDAAWQDVRKKTADAHMSEINRDVAEEAQKQGLQLEQIIENVAKTRLGNAETQKRIELLNKEGKLKDFEIQLNESGVTKGDALWVRLVSSFLRKHLGISF